MASILYKTGRIVQKNSFGKIKEENITAEEYSRKYGSSENRPRILCPGCGFDGKSCEAELHLSSNSGTAYFAANDRDAHRLGCRYALAAGRRIQPNIDKLLPFDISIFGKSKTQKEENNLSRESEAYPPEDGDVSSVDISDIDLGDVSMHGVSDPDSNEDTVFGMKSNDKNGNERIVLERPRAFPDIAKTMLSAEACNATKDGYMIEDQLFCRRTADYFIDPNFKMERDDCFVFIGEKCPGLSIELTNEMKLRNTIFFRNPYDRDLSTLFAVVCPDDKVYFSLLELIKRKENVDHKRFVLGLSFQEKKRHKFQGEMRDIRFFKLNDIKYTTVMTEEMDKLDREF